MARSARSPRPSRAGDISRSSYWETSKRPLQILIFLAPLIVAYEIGMALLLRSDDQQITVNAHYALVRFFQAFGLNATSGFFFLGGIVIVVVLFIWHLLNRDRWSVDWPALAYTAVESLVLTLPLLVLGQLIAQSAAAAAAVAAVPFAAGDSPLNTLGLPSKLAIGIGAGLYEEFMFRMILLAVLHTLLVDAAKVPQTLGLAVSVVLSAVAFTAYHQIREISGRINVRTALFFFLAGLYLGAIYLARGFGIVVATHALYDIIVFVLKSGNES
jgi:membrane protease YdiL (CAAX protease family)